MRNLGLAIAAAITLAVMSILFAPQTQAQSNTLWGGFFDELRKIGAPPPPPAPAKAAPAKPAAKPAAKKEDSMKAAPSK
jgi:hypothetical protein